MTRRPLWKRLASRARDAVYRLITPVDRMLRGNRHGILPPAHLRLYYYRTLEPARYARACDDVRNELMSRGLQPQHRVLDIGSGIGNLAIGLIDYLEGGYDGIEIHREAVEWCQAAITSAHPQFRFHRADLESSAYNPQGAADASGYRFPFPDETFDFILLSSVFTHMLPAEVEHYVQEIARVLKPQGACVASFFLLNDETYAGVAAGRSFIPFPYEHPSRVYRLHDELKPAAAVAFQETFVHQILANAGLVIREIRRGQWWSGLAHDQDIVTMAPKA